METTEQLSFLANYVAKTHPPTETHAIYRKDYGPDTHGDILMAYFDGRNVMFVGYSVEVDLLLEFTHFLYKLSNLMLTGNSEQIQDLRDENDLRIMQLEAIMSPVVEIPGILTVADAIKILSKHEPHLPIFSSNDKDTTYRPVTNCLQWRFALRQIQDPEKDGAITYIDADRLNNGFSAFVF